MMTKPLIWAHRGASGYAPENTLAAFELAAKMHADGVELDIQLTRDGELAVCHDERIDRTSSAKGFLKDYTLTELKQLDFSNGNLAYEGIRIPTMREVFDLLKPTGLSTEDRRLLLPRHRGEDRETDAGMRDGGPCPLLLLQSLHDPTPAVPRAVRPHGLSLRGRLH